MLCRVADSLFWMSRYIERADNTARLVEVTFQTLLDADFASDDDAFSRWEPILLSIGDLKLFENLFEEKTSYNVTYFLMFSRENPSSVFSCIAAARENARMIRDQISTEMWEIINRLYLFLKNSSAQRICSEMSFDFLQRVKEFSLLFQGTTESTFSHDQGYEFLTCGFQLERADKTCRIVDSKRYLQQLADEELNVVMDTAEWAAVLRACSAFEAYQHEFVTSPERDSVLKLLLLSRTFPRSALFCINRLQLSVHAISGCPVTHFSNESERQVGILVSRLLYSSQNDISTENAGPFIEQIEDSLALLAQELSNQYMFARITDPAAELVES